MDVSQHFEQACEAYIRAYSHRSMRELTGQFWLAHEVAQRVGGPLTAVEVNLCKADICAHLGTTPLEQHVRGVDNKKRGQDAAVNFDVCVANSDRLDARTWKTIRHDNPDHTRDTLHQLALVAELKILPSTSTAAKSVLEDFIKLKALLQTCRAQTNETQHGLPQTYIVLHSTAGVQRSAWRTLLRSVHERLPRYWDDQSLPRPTLITNDPEDPAEAIIIRSFGARSEDLPA